MNDEVKPNIAFARELANKLLSDADVHSSPVVMAHIVKYLKTKYSLRVLPYKLGKKTSGVQATNDDIIIIAYNDKQHPHRQRFTVAHEIGHLIIGHTHKGNDYDPDSKDIHEVEANAFAAELLMPENWLKDDYLLRETDPKVLASNYQVSEHAMWIRLLECNIIKY